MNKSATLITVTLPAGVYSSQIGQFSSELVRQSISRVSRESQDIQGNMFIDRIRVKFLWQSLAEIKGFAMIF